MAAVQDELADTKDALASTEVELLAAREGVDRFCVEQIASVRVTPV